MKRDRDISEYIIYSSHISKIEDSYSIFSGLFSFRWESNCFFYKQWISLFHFIHLASNLYIYHIKCFNRNRLGDCRGLTIGWWTCSLMIRPVASPYSELKWLAAGDSELTFLLQEKKWPKEKKKPEHHFNQIQLKRSIRTNL